MYVCVLWRRLTQKFRLLRLLYLKDAPPESPKSVAEKLVIFTEKKMDSFRSGICCFLFVLLSICLTCGTPTPLGVASFKAYHVPPEKSTFSLSKLFIWPNTYYDKPRHRYPYYDKDGNGELVYGYGGRSLYKYSIFRPLEGYFKWGVKCQTLCDIQVCPWDVLPKVSIQLDWHAFNWCDPV